MTESTHPHYISALPALSEGQIYDSFDDAINAARNHAAVEQFSYRVKERNRKRAYLCCASKGCPAYIRICGSPLPGIVQYYPR